MESSSLANCLIEVNSDNTDGSTSASVNIDYVAIAGGTRVTPSTFNNQSSTSLNTTVPVRIWYPTILNVKLKDDVLNRIT